MDFGRAEAAGAPKDDVAVFVVPFERRTRANAEFLAHLGRNRDLALRGDFGFGDGHGITLPG